MGRDNSITWNPTDCSDTPTGWLSIGDVTSVSVIGGRPHTSVLLQEVVVTLCMYSGHDGWEGHHGNGKEPGGEVHDDCLGVEDGLFLLNRLMFVFTIWECSALLVKMKE